MNKKTAAALSRIILVSFVMLLNIAAMSSAATTITWDNGASPVDGNWNNGLNWSTDTVPPNNSSYYAKISMATGPTLSTGQTAAAYRVYLEGTSGNNGTLIMSGGTLNLSSSWVGIGYTAANSGTLTVNSGTINTTGLSGHLYCAAAGTATFNMSGGAINLSGTFYVAQGATGIGTANISGGTITCNNLNMNTNPGAVGTINLSGGIIDCNTNPPAISALTNGGTAINITSSGKLIISGDATAFITTCVNDGRIKAYGGAGGVVMKDFNVTTPGKTTVWGIISYKALTPTPTSDTNNVAVNGTNLIWKPGFAAASHDVYLGTDSNDVNNANRLLGDLNGDGTVDKNDMLLLAEHWLDDPAGTEPYEGVNDDNFVDFFDYALFAQDWMNSAGLVFKGNWDANSFSPGILAFGTTYYWRIDEVSGPNTAKGDIWNFTTQTGKASNVTPANGEPNVLSRAVLAWTAGLGAVSHDVYFGTTDPPDFVVNQTAAIYNPGGAIANSTTYYWRIDEKYGTTTIQGDVWSFTTIDAANEPDFVFVQASDPQMGWGQCGGTTDYLWGVTVGKINNLNPDFMLVTGDLVDSSTNAGQVATYKSYKSALNPTIECFEVPGNHDLGLPPNQDKYNAWATNYGYGIPPNAVPWYSFAYGNSFFIGVDSVVLTSPFNGKDVEQINWLTTQLQEANSAGYEHIFVFMHHPLFVGEWPAAMRDEVTNLFHTYNVNAVFAGHTHYDVYSLDGTMENITTRSCTCNLSSGPPPAGVRIIKVYPDRIEHEIRTIDSLP